MRHKNLKSILDQINALANRQKCIAETRERLKAQYYDGLEQMLESAQLRLGELLLLWASANRERLEGTISRSLKDEDWQLIHQGGEICRVRASRKRRIDAATSTNGASASADEQSPQNG